MGSYCVPVLFKFPIQPQFLRKIRFKQAFINTEKGTMNRRERGTCLSGCRGCRAAESCTLPLVHTRLQWRLESR